MNTSRMGRAAVLWGLAALCLLWAASPSRAITTSTLYTEGFTSSSAFNALSGYKSSFDGWYWTSYGRGGLNGSIGFNTYYGRNEQGIGLPVLDAGAFSSDADSTFIEFDLCIPKNYYDLYSGSNSEFYVKVGGSQVLKVTKSDYYSAIASTYGYYSSPSPWTSTSYWRHYRVLIPKAQRSASMQITLSGKGTNQYGYYYPYSQPFWIDNIVVSNNHYTFVTLGPTSLNFGNLGKGLTSQAQYVAIQNPNSTPVTISNIALAGSNPGDYQIVYSPAGMIQPGMSDSIGVVFNPQFKDFRAANLIFQTDVDMPRNASVSLLGFGLVPIINLPEGNTMFRKTRVAFDDQTMTSIPVTNVGLSPLIVDSTATYIEGDAGAQYTIVQQPVAPILPGATDSLTIVFTPTQEGQQSAYLHLNSNADNGEQVVTFKASGILPHLEISPRNVLFDSTEVGKTNEVTVTLTNSGSDTLKIGNYLLSASDYDFAATMLTGADTLILPGEAKTITVKFTPLRSGTRVARLHLTTNIPLTFESPRHDSSAFDISLMGYAIPVGILSAGPVTTDTAIVGQSSCQNSSITNSGAAAITVTSAKIVGRDSAEFTLSGVTLPLTLAAGGSQAYSLCVTPSQRGDRQAQLLLAGTSNDRPVSVSLPLSAYGVQACASAATTTALGSQTCAGYSDTATITVANCGDISTTYTAALETGATNFTIVGNPTSASVSAGGATTFQIAYTPTSRGSENATLTVTGGEGVSPMTVDLSAVGASASIVGSGTAPATAVGATSTAFEVGVQNTGECDFTPGTPTVTGPFAYVSGGDQPIAPGQSGTLMFTYSPTTSGNAVGVVSFPSAIGVSIPAANVTITGSTPASVANAEAYGFSLAQNYPNPFRTKAEIDFVVPYSARVTLDVLDAKGSFLTTVFSGIAEQGTHAVSVDANALVGRDALSTGAALASGTYFYRLTSENPAGAPVVLLRQMVLVK